MSRAPKQDALRALVAAHPGEYAVWYARRVGPHGSRRYGYQTIERATARGTVERRPDPAYPHRTRLWPARTGATP